MTTYPGGVLLPPHVPFSTAERKLTLSDPRITRARDMGVQVDGPEKIIEMREDFDGVYVPRGAAELFGWVRHPGMPRVVDIAPRDLFDDGIVRSIPRPTADLRDYQTKAVDALVTSAQGYVVAPPGSGKTWIGAAAAGAVGLRTLVLVPTIDILDQWVKAFLSVLDLHVARRGGGRKEHGHVTVATIQGFLDFDDREVIQYGAKFDVVILDECHSVGAETFRRLFWLLPCPVRWGLTATPYRDDGLTDLIGWTFGRELYEIDHESLISAGHLRRPRVERVNVDFAYPLSHVLYLSGRGYGPVKHLRPKPDVMTAVREALAYAYAYAGRPVKVWGIGDDEREAVATLCKEHGAQHKIQTDPKSWAACMKELTMDPQINDMIVDYALEAVEEGGTFLALCGRVEWCQRLARRVQDKGVDADALFSKVGVKKRRTTLERLRSGDLHVVFATTLADVGLDVPTLDRAVIAFPGRAKGRATQRLGRLMRPDGALQPLIRDLVQVNVPPLLNQWWSRKRAYIEIGAEVI